MIVDEALRMQLGRLREQIRLQEDLRDRLELLYELVRRERDMVYSRGEFFDEIHYGMTRDEFDGLYADGLPG